MMNKTKSLKNWKSVFLIISLSLCFSLLLFANVIDPADNEINKKNDNALPLVSQKDETLPGYELESSAADINANINQTFDHGIDQTADISEVSRSAPIRTSKNIQSAAESETEVQIPDIPQDESTSEKSYSYDDLNLLARLIHAEAQAEPYEAKVAVGAVVLNRIGPFEDSIKGVIYQNIDGFYQFTPVENGWINKPAGEDSIKAAREALDGADPTNGALFYYDNQTTNEWILAKPVSVTFGNMIYAY
ncbi:MAG: cell wall hydrolase [Eubacteriales bacterium]|nr:cell wall hydrolase [Eubacteriales bacterium]MDD3199899.1 cell wall hydrolase [Eubacteriales bacterium]MDD4630510.1 cell wall hydrolase [Eubacteriales bacterium]